MANHRTPSDKADVSGASAKNPGRFAGRSKPKRTRPLGEPYKKMNEVQREYWAELASECPWLHSSHRPIVRMAATYLAKMDSDDGITTTEYSALSSVLSKLGATPADESRVSHGGKDDADPDDEFFTTH